MSHRTSAEVVCDSVTSYGDATRLTSMYVVFPKIVLAERNRHRGFSLSDRSSRAVPPEKLIAEVRDDPAMPAKFRRYTTGMGGGDMLVAEDLILAQQQWSWAAVRAAEQAQAMTEVHSLAKEIANRPLDPFIRMYSLMTATRDVWLNFFGLRLDAGADPTIQVLAQRCFDAYKASTPRLLQPGDWHLPFIDSDSWNECASKSLNHFQIIELVKKFSAARCAHLSYNAIGETQRMTVEKALSIYDKLVGSTPLHLSPLEHQATPNAANGQRIVWRGEGRIELDENGTPFILEKDGKVVPKGLTLEPAWINEHEQGNLFGWRQARKLLKNESVAPLPEGYTL